MAYLFFLACHAVACVVSVAVFNTFAGVWISQAWVIIAGTYHLILKVK